MATSTGSPELDAATGLGGFPHRLCEVFGPRHSGTTMMALRSIAALQQKGGKAAFLDAARDLSWDFARKLGVDPDALAFYEPQSAQVAMVLIEELCQDPEISLIVLDHVTALAVTADREGGRRSSGLAQLLSRNLPRISALANRTNTTVLFLNKTIKGPTASGAEPQRQSCGGNALKFYSELRIFLQPMIDPQAGTQISGAVKVEVVKNRSQPFPQTCEINLWDPQ